MSDGLMTLALLPGILIIIFIFRKDKIEREPVSLIVKLVLFGVLSCIPAIFLELFISELGPVYAEGTLTYALYEAFVIAALCEEICKYVFLRLGSWRHKAFDYRFDGIVYGVSVAVGFALLENILYVMEGGFYTALMRAFLAVPLHAFCGLFMGVAYGAAKRDSIEGNRAKQRKATFMALFVPIMIHGIYDTLVFLNGVAPFILLLVFVAFLYVIAIKYVNKYSREDWSGNLYRSTLSQKSESDW